MKKTTAIYAALAMAALMTSGCAYSIATIGGDLAGPVINKVLSPLSGSSETPDALTILKKQQEMIEQVKKAGMTDYSNIAKTPDK